MLSVRPLYDVYLERKIRFGWIYRKWEKVAIYEHIVYHGTFIHHTESVDVGCCQVLHGP